MSPRNEQDDILLCDIRKMRQEWNSSPAKFERPKKRVRISCEDPVTYPERMPLRYTQSSCNEGKPERYRTWLNRQELAYFRSCAKRLCLEVHLEDELQNVNLRATSLESREKSSHIADLAENDDFVEQRGLERWSSTRHSILRRVKIVEVRTALFLEQASQVMSGRKDPDLLAKVTSEASKASQSLAQYLASADAIVAMQVREEHHREQGQENRLS